MSKPTIEKFINKAQYDRDGQMIFGVQQSGHCQLILDLRGWGAIQHLFDNQDDAGKFQDDLGEWIADAINQKLKSAK